MDNEPENLDSSTEELENLDSQNETPEQEPEETKEEYTEREKQYYARIKALEKQLKSKETTPAPETGMSPKDFLALKESNVTAEDLEEVQDFARYKGIPLAEALSHPTLKNILNDRQEERRTARATETKSPRGIAKNSAEDVLRKAEATGEVPESYDAMRQLAEARLARRRK